MSVVHELRSRIQDFIRHPRRLNPLVGDMPNWNMLVSSFDTVADTEMAIVAFESLEETSDIGLRYLRLYGVMQCLYVQQDAVQSMVRAFEPNRQTQYKIEEEPEALEVRRIRNRATGHPTKEGEIRSRKRPGIQMSHFIVQTSLSKSSFTLMTSNADAPYEFRDVNVLELIGKNRIVVERVLGKILRRLEEAEMEHRQAFKGERLADLFPETLNYFFGKLLEGTRNPKSAVGQFAKIQLEFIAGNVARFRACLEDRNLLNPPSTWESELADVEYPLAELRSYWDSSGSLKDARAADIFVYFLRDRVLRLRQAAMELDEEYQDTEATS